MSLGHQALEHQLHLQPEKDQTARMGLRSQQFSVTMVLWLRGNPSNLPALRAAGLCNQTLHGASTSNSTTRAMHA